jgi:uncharacterized membrane protein
MNSKVALLGFVPLSWSTDADAKEGVEILFIGITAVI